jgi:Tfp pilus assembly protein PilX
MNLTNVSKINNIRKERMLKLGNVLKTRIVGGVAETVADPVFDPETGDYYYPCSVTISCSTDGATIYYEITTESYNAPDPPNPTSESTEYTGAILLSHLGETTVYKIKAIAIKSGATSNIIMETYCPNYNP